MLAVLIIVGTVWFRAFGTDSGMLKRAEFTIAHSTYR
jgi:hypothetical protein